MKTSSGRGLRTTLRSAIAYPVIILSTMIVGGVAYLGTFAPARWRIPDKAARVWSRIFLRVAGVTFQVRGQENLQPDRPQVIVSNHLSNLDPMIEWLALWPVHYRYMAKKEVYKIPIFRTIIKAMHMVKVDREAGAGGYDFINQQVRDVFDMGYSLLVYGEGTRSPRGTIKEFKKGPFMIAKAVGAPILPVTIYGSEHAWPPGDWRMYGGTATVVIHPMIDLEGTVEEMRERTREIIVAGYRELDAAP